MTVEKNIIFLTNIHLWSLGAGKGGKAFYHTIQGYINGGWNVTLISTGGGIPEVIQQKIKTVEVSFPLLEKMHNSGNKIISVLGRFLKLAAQTRFYAQAATTIIRTNPNKKYIIYGYEVEAVKAAKSVATKFKFPLVTRFQGTVIANEPQHWFHRLKRTPHFSALSEKADLVIMTNDGTQGLAVLKRLKNASKKIVFWRNGVDRINDAVIEARNDTRKQLGYGSDNLVFVTVSRLIDWKRVHLAIAGFAAISKQNPNARLLVVGDGPEKVALEQQAIDLDIQSSVIFTGAVEQLRVQYLQAASDVFLSFYDLSNLGNPIMEAMMVGLPIITIDVGDTRELIQNEINGILIPADKLELIPEKMQIMASDDKTRAFYATASKNTALKEFWSWEERILAELEAVNELLAK